MKASNFFTLIILSLVVLSCNGQDSSKTTAMDESILKIEVLDFHSTHRCMTCNAIEKNTKYTLNTYFSSELAEGTITFQVINVDKKENQKIAEKFEAAGTSLFLNVIKNGRERQINLTEFAFMNGNDQAAFSNGLKAKLDNQLKKL